MKRIAIAITMNQNNIELFQIGHQAYRVTWGSTVFNTADREVALNTYTSWITLAASRELP